MEIDEKTVKRLLATSPFNSQTGNLDYVACVGENGGYNQLTIYEGFIEAVDIMFDSIASYENQPDPMVYPILFCFRHSIELFLKALYTNLQIIRCERNNHRMYRKLLKASNICSRFKEIHEAYDMRAKCAENADLREHYQKRKVTIANRLNSLEEHAETLSHSIYCSIEEAKHNHDLDSLINSICSVYDIEVRIKELFDELLPTLEYYRKIDPDGDAFRYWSSIAGIPHFASKDIGTVNIRVLHVHYLHAKTGFETISSLMGELSKEYQTGTFTKELSRDQIKEIAQLLPKPHEFADKIKTVKKKLMEKYGIRSNKFDEVMQIIRGHREFSMLMGNEILFRSLSSNAINLFVRSSLGIDEWKEAAHKMRKDEIALFLTFADVSGWRHGPAAYFSEDLNSLYLHIRDQYSDIDYYIINPVATVKHVIRGMKKCGQETYASMMKQALDKWTTSA